MTACRKHLDDGPLVCTSDEGHDHGCTFESATGSSVPDRHTEGVDRE